MEEERPIISTISELIHRARPLTAASSLIPSCPISTSDKHKNSAPYLRRKPSVAACQNPNPQTLKPLKHPTVLIGTLTLPSFANSNSPIKCSCFQFSDDSSTICCEILDFNPKIIGSRIRILAWNFIPLKCGDRGVKGGFLEIISWEFIQAFGENVCSLSDFSSFCLASGACDVKDNSTASCSIFGMIESMSPVFVVPCASGESGSRNISGFLVNVLVCQCKFCVSKFLVSELKDLCQKNVEDHNFMKTVIVYFCGLSSSWHPVISRFTGEVVLLIGLKKKLVFIRKEQSQLMYVTTDEVSLHIPKLFEKRGSIPNAEIRGKGECGCYTGVVTGVYMQGMVVELDQNVILLLTDQHLTVPHCMRVGAIVTVKNVHFVDPKFRWGKMLILGACCRTSMYVESFSPSQTGCHLKSYSQSLLQKFINSLPSAARLWALLVVSCFRKKFAGILSEKEILGSKHKEGLAQKYASYHLPPSAFQDRQGVLVEFCKHDLCPSGNEGHYGHLRLVLPIANLISYCESSWKKILDDPENLSDVGGINTKKHLSCGGRSYVHSTRRILQTDEIGILALGTLKISLSSGRLQLVDATGGIDIKLDLPATLDSDRIFEAKDFTLVMEGIPQKLVNLDSTIHQPLSCRSIFSNALQLRRMKASLYLYRCPTDEDSRSRSLFFDWKGNPPEPDTGKFHLIMLTHKFPALQKFQGDLAKRSNMFAEAMVLPWDLLLSGEHNNAIMTSEYWKKYSLENCTRPETNFTPKRCKFDEVSVEGSKYGLHDLPCLIATKGVSFHRSGFLHCTNDYAKIVSRSKLTARVLLEFNPNSFSVYEVMRIGRCYLVKHQDEDKLCSIKEKHQVSHAKLPISCGTHVWSLKFSSMETLQSSKDSENYSDINVFVASSSLQLLENVIKIMDGGPIKPRDSLEEQSSGASFSNYPLPEGTLVNLHGLIVAIHDCSNDAFPAQPEPRPDEGYLAKFLRGNNDICVHVLVDNQIVKIFCDLSKQTYPIGFGKDVYATFHRILVLCGQNRYMMIPVSFITISDKSSKNGHLIDEPNSAFGNVGLLSGVASQNTFPTALISDALELSELKPMKFRCRVVAVYILVMEKGRTGVFSSSVHSKLSAVGIPFAGFIMDDGSSSCCCWADSERAAALLGIDSEEFSAESFRRSKDGKSLPCSSTIGQLNRILEDHGRIVVKNYGSLYDSSCQDLVYSVGSERFISISDEEFLRSLITNAFLSTSWSIVGSVMDPESRSWLEGRLAELDMPVPTLLNIWATSVSHTDILAEARNIFQELV